MSKHIANEARDPDSCCKRMMAILLDGAFITRTKEEKSTAHSPHVPHSFTMNQYVAKDFDELVDKLFAYVQQRDHAILSQLMERMDNNFIEKQKAKSS